MKDRSHNGCAHVVTVCYRNSLVTTDWDLQSVLVTVLLTKLDCSGRQRAYMYSGSGCKELRLADAFCLSLKVCLFHHVRNGTQ